MQVGGSDQWGNIIAGVDMINHMSPGMPKPDGLPVKGYGLTTPLLTNPQGQKMGKSEGNALWLDPQMTSPFDFFQVSSSAFVNY